MKKISLLIFMVFFSIGFSQDSKQDIFNSSSLVKLDQIVPKFSFTTADGKTLNLSDYKGKVILINFFATWCGPCMTEMPHIENDIWKNLKDNPNFTILSIGRDHSQEEINAFIKNHNYTFPIYADKGKKIYNLFATQYIPRNYLIDQSGKVVYASIGFYEEEFQKLIEKINSLLEIN